MKVTNLFLDKADTPKWEMSPDGFLRCRARILASRIMPYHKSECGDLPPDFDGETVNMLVPLDEMSSEGALRSLEGAQITIGDHKWLTSDNIREFGMGSVVGTPVIDGEYLVCDLQVTDEDAIEMIQSKKCSEISGAYLADAVYEPGEQDEKHYDAKQTNLCFNHIAILPAGHGRAGTDVRILNKKKGEKIMADSKTQVRVQLRNTGRFVNTDDDGAAALKDEETAMAEGEKKSASDLSTTMTDLESKNGEMESLQAEIEELKGELSVYKEKLDQLLAEETIEHAAANMVEENGEGEEIIENMMPDDSEDNDDKAKMMNSIKGLYGSNLHEKVLTALGVKCENMSPDALRGAFKAQAQIANSLKGKGSSLKVAGEKMMNSQKADSDAAGTRTPRERLGIK